MEVEQAPARLLAIRSEVGYTHVPALALRDEPEAVDEQTQIELTRQARRRAAHRLRDDWVRTRLVIASALAEFKTGASFDRQVADDVRAVERAVERTDRHVAELARNS